MHARMGARCLVLSALALFGCDDDGASADPPPDAAGMGGSPGAGGAPGMGGDPGAGGDPADAGPGADMGVECPDEGRLDPDCDPINPYACSMPWPSNLYLEEDATRTTGYTLAFGATSLPANVEDVHVDPTAWRRMDGYGPGEALLVILPGVDVSTLPSEHDLADSLAEDAAIVWYEVKGDTMRRVPYWVELDAYEEDPSIQTLFVRPAVLLQEDAHHYVAFRGLTDTTGAAIGASHAFRQLRDDDPCAQPVVADRRARFEGVFSFFEAQGVERGTLQLAWDFHTASSDSLHGWMLHLRDAALAAVGDTGPELTVLQVTEFAPAPDDSGREVNEHIALELYGTFRSPYYLKPDGPFRDQMGSVMNLGDDGMPTQNGWHDPEFWIRIPHTALDGTAHGLVQYGHGLLGKGSQVRGSFNSKIAADHKFIFFASDWTGMAEPDEPNIQAIITEMSYFPWLADRMHQGMVDFLVLAQAMRGGAFAALDAVTTRGITLDTDRFYYSGISQGGIYGATYLALSPVLTRGHLGVPGQNYSTLLHRSVDFEPFFAVVEQLYGPRYDEALILSTIQQLWNQTDPVSYYRHLSADPFPGNPVKHAIGAPARGDYQVAPVTMEIVARSDVGFALMENYDDERTVDLVEPTAYPHEGSAIVNWHFGNPWPPAGNRPPPEHPNGDPHGKPRRLDSHNTQMVHFFETGEVVDVCEGGLCPPPSERP